VKSHFQEKIWYFPLKISISCTTQECKNFTTPYYMASSTNGQDESNPGLWLATRAGKMELSCPLGTTRCVLLKKFPRKPYNKSFIDQACSVKMAGYCPRSFFASLWTLTQSWSINSQKQNLANIQSSWLHTWSITHIYYPISPLLSVMWLPKGVKNKRKFQTFYSKSVRGHLYKRFQIQ